MFFEVFTAENVQSVVTEFHIDLSRVARIRVAELINEGVPQPFLLIIFFVIA